MTSINTLITDVYELLKSKEEWFKDELATDMVKKLQTQLNYSREKGTLGLSQMGPRCPKALWYSVHHPELAETLPPWTEVKFAFGHIIETLAITLAKATGHEVTGEQDAVSVDGIIGHRDCVIDGYIVDVKSASSRSFSKFKDRSLTKDDPFGYLDQLDGYVVGSYNDPLVRIKDQGYLWAIDKTLGHMVLYRHEIRESSIRSRIRDYKNIIESRVPPLCQCRTIPQGASGNYQLDVRASYSPYKHSCFPFLRTFIYSNGPVYLTKVVRVPDVREVTRYH